MSGFKNIESISEASNINLAIFIVGSPRSGTTLMQSILACAPSITAITESHFFSKGIFKCGPIVLPKRFPQQALKEYWHDNGCSPELMPSKLKERVGLNASKHCDRYADALISVANYQGKKILLEKTPRHLHYVTEIQSAFSRRSIPVKFIHVVREMDDVIRSILKASQHWRKPRDMNNAQKRWEKDISISAAYIGVEDHIFCSYSDLVDSPDQEIAKIAAELEISLDKNRLEKRTLIMNQIVKENETWKTEPKAGYIQQKEKTMTEREHKSVPPKKFFDYRRIINFVNNKEIK